MIDLSAESGILLCTVQTPEGRVGVFRVKDSDARPLPSRWIAVHESMMNLPDRGRVLYSELGVLKEKAHQVEFRGASWGPGEYSRYTELRELEQRDLRASRHAQYATVLNGCRVWIDDDSSGFFGITRPQDASLHLSHAGDTMDKAVVTLDIGPARPEFLSRIFPVWEPVAASVKSARDFQVALPANAHPGSASNRVPGSGIDPAVPGETAARNGIGG